MFVLFSCLFAEKLKVLQGTNVMFAKYMESEEEPGEFNHAAYFFDSAPILSYSGRSLSFMFQVSIYVWMWQAAVGWNTNITQRIQLAFS